MIRHHLRVAVTAAAALALTPNAPFGRAIASAQDTPAPKLTGVALLKDQSTKLAPLVKSQLARDFLGATSALPERATRTVYRNKDKNLALTAEAYNQLPETDRAGFTPKECDENFYYQTGYGSPLVYARPLDLLAQHGFSSANGKYILDFGYGTIGQLRLLASLGARASGVDVEPLFKALYSQFDDTGNIESVGNDPPGFLSIFDGQWPANADLAKQVNGGYDLFISKNTLKRGYIHPARETDPKRLVHLGVDDAAFLKSVYTSLNPGGLFMIYNICPAQNPPEKDYIPWADGECPFPRELCEKAGFEILEFDHIDNDAILDYWMALGYDQGKGRDDAAKNTFAWYTLMRRPGAAAEPKHQE